MSRVGTDRPWTAKEREFLKENSHLKAPELAKLLNRTPLAVRMAKKRWGVTNPKAHRTGPITLRLLRYYRKGWSDERIAQVLFVNPETVRRWRLQKGLPANGWSASARGYQSAVKKRQVLRPVRPCGTPGRRPETGSPGRVNTEDEVELLKAVMAFRSRHQRPPTLIEGYRIAVSLGWSKEVTDVG